jgi:hypothetical protein
MVKIHSKSEKSELCYNQMLANLKVTEAAWQSGFYQLAPKKIFAENLLVGFWEMQRKSKNTLRNWAIECGMLLESKQAISKQAIDDRLNNHCLKMVQQLLNQSLNMKYVSIQNEVNKVLTGMRNEVSWLFNRILLQDSTIQSLPPNLSDIFHSSHTGSEKAAMLRLQATFDITQMCWVAFFIGTYKDNDQSQSQAIVKVAQKRDLILRDLGYFTLDSLELLLKEQYVITKWDNQSNLYFDEDFIDSSSDKAYKKGDKIKLLEYLKGKQNVDIQVQVGSKKRLKMRLVANKLPKKKAQKRIEEAKKNRHSKSNHSDEYYELLKWEFFLTNIAKNQLAAEKIVKLYGLRCLPRNLGGFIEILFKSWKSYCNFKKMLGKEKMNYTRLMITINLLLIYFVYFILDIFRYIAQKVAKSTGKLISILKFMDVLNDLFDFIIRIEQIEELDILIPQFSKHATYEKRNKRKNMMQKCLDFTDLSPFLFTP